MGSDFGARYRKGADGELEELEAFGGATDLEVSGFRRVEGGDSVPRSGERTGVLERNRDELGSGKVGLELLE